MRERYDLTMPDKRPILILQMQRMGDLILSFPLMLWLQRLHPGRPIWVVAEEMFYKELMPVGPKVVYFPWHPVALNRLPQHTYRLVINLSHRYESAELAGRLEADQVLGPCQRPGQGRYVLGDWQLYRASVVRSNRHNRFHWADLNALDCVPLSDIAGTLWGPPRQLPPDARKVGLFLGASRPDKRPGVSFWSALATDLLRRDLRPVLMGGPAERDMGAEVARHVKGPVLNTCGTLKLSEFAGVGQTLSLMVTPDTGPMHLAAWSGLKTLALSMGPVNSWETAAYQPGHYVLRTGTSCVGCWECNRPEPLCRRNFKPSRVGMLAETIVRGREDRLDRVHFPGLRLLRTGRSRHGLFALDPVNAMQAGSARQYVSAFWQEFWGGAFGLWDPAGARRDVAALEAAHPLLRRAMAEAAPDLLRKLGPALRLGAEARLDENFWRRGPIALRPMRSTCQLVLENGDYAPAARQRCVALLDSLAAALAS